MPGGNEIFLDTTARQLYTDGSRGVHHHCLHASKEIIMKAGLGSGYSNEPKVSIVMTHPRCFDKKSRKTSFSHCKLDSESQQNLEAVGHNYFIALPVIYFEEIEIYNSHISSDAF